MVRQVEKHAGPHSPWFFRREEAGGGALMDMGCHGIELIRWLLGGATPVDIFARVDRFVHEDMDLDDHAIVDMRFPDGTLGISESSWTLQGGMASVLEVFGSKGYAVADLCQGTGLRVFSHDGYGMMPDAAKGWTTPVYDHDRQYGYVAQLEHIVGCIRSGEPPIEGLAEGRTVLSILLAAYESARAGRAVAMPFEPRGVVAPVDLWRRP
jgi:predicted dehydrogenase